MGTEKEYRELFDRVAALRGQVAGKLANELGSDPKLGDALLKQLDDMLVAVETDQRTKPGPADGGIASLVGIGDTSAPDLGQTSMPPGVDAYDETVASERVIAVGDLYYLYQHERIGVFRVVQKLQELFQRGAIRLSDGPGAFGLYRFDRRDVLRYTKRDRIDAYRRVLGYGRGLGSANARPNTDFHQLFTQFNNQVALFWRDKRISDVIRERAYDPSFGSVAVVRRGGLDLRNNLKFTSYGHLNVLRVEVMQLLTEAFRILGAEDVRDLFGATNAWDTVDKVLIRYFDERLVSSPRQRMAVTGRQVLRWLAAPHILETTRSEFEALLLEIAEPAEEWITSAQSLRVADRTSSPGVLPIDRQRPAGVAAESRADRPVTPRRNGHRPGAVTLSRRD
ncbi:hypothetical protein DMA12_43570 [Amycolatopsis balhimycina DSM 5908]|uniref:Uncharacterized protein n=1 Tax=Amycolatopsis balhimycina DSM 5908 TaxID=1081091 RepID=A0A428VXQ4_AMYBA|nr:hypothetical protein [Amycolatopsis balhimycina]RSM35605.1 hypothetical protein DMA12_43570 [Amycolatopsis balhimycina DSM 5908]